MALTVASVRLCTGSNGLKCVHLIGLQRLLVFQAAEHSQIDGIVILRPRGQRAVKDDLVGGDFSRQNGSPRVSLFCVSVPVLSAQSTSTPANSSIATSLLTIACFFASRRAPTAIVTDSTVGIATGIAATVSTSANCNVVRIGSPRKNANSDDHGDEDHSQNDQVVADLQHGLLKMADGDRRLHQFRRLAKISFAARRVDKRADFAPTKIEPENTASPDLRVAGNDSPVSAD